MSYEPVPLDTSHIALPAALEPLLERLARNTHENWAARRRAEGWRWGPRRDDAAKTHPCLVPYDDLPDEEKAYDHTLAVETIRMILAAGFEIRPADEAGRGV